MVRVNQFRTGALVQSQISILGRSKKRAFFEHDVRKRDYFWTAVYFNGICLKYPVKKRLLIPRSHREDLNGITGYSFLSAPNISNIYRNKYRRGSNKNRGFFGFIIRQHRKSLRRLRLRFSNQIYSNMTNSLKKYENLVRLSRIKKRAFFVQCRVKFSNHLGAIGAEPLKQIFLGYSHKGKYVLRLRKLLSSIKLNRYRELSVDISHLSCRRNRRSRLNQILGCHPIRVSRSGEVKTFY